jgi:hypothetical protein
MLVRSLGRGLPIAALALCPSPALPVAALPDWPGSVEVLGDRQWTTHEASFPWWLLVVAGSITVAVFARALRRRGA